MERSLSRSIGLSIGIHTFLLIPIGFNVVVSQPDVIRGTSNFSVELAPWMEGNLALDYQVSFPQKGGKSPDPLGSLSHSVSSENQEGAFIRTSPQTVKNPPPRYPWIARVNGWEGTVLVRAIISSYGKPTQIQVTKSSGYASLDEAVLTALRQWQFLPRRRTGTATAAVVEIPVTFKLEEKERRL